MAYNDQNIHRVHANSYFSNNMSDDAFVQLWLSRVKISNRNDKTASLSQFSMKNIITELLSLCEKIKTTECYMRDNVSVLSKDAFDEKLQSISIVKSQIDHIIATLNDGSLVQLTKNKMAKRINKRARIKRNKNAIQIERKKQKQSMELKSKQLEEWLNEERIEYNKKIKNDELKLQADTVLKDVNKRKAEAKRYLLLIEQLCRLRDAREKSALGRGMIILPSDKQVFSTFIEKLKFLWKTALIRYGLEETRLKDMLNKDEETFTPGSKITEDSCNYVTIVNRWKYLMFGNKDTLPQDNSQTIDQFIYMRKQWDQYVCPDEEGTRIPLGWIVPSLPSDDWKKYVKIDCGI